MHKDRCMSRGGVCKETGVIQQTNLYELEE